MFDNFSIRINRYINNITDKANSYFYGIYHYKFINIFRKFEQINVYLISRALDQNNKSSFLIQTLDEKSTDDLYLPVILTIFHRLYLQNNSDLSNRTEFIIGDLVNRTNNTQKYVIKNIYIDNGERKYQLEEIGKRKYPCSEICLEIDKQGVHINQKFHKEKFIEYEELVNELFGRINILTHFNFKTVICLEKKQFDESLLEYRESKNNLKKALPFKWVTKNGSQDDYSEHIHIEPMIYLVPDYETFKEHIEGNVGGISSLFFIGSNKYKNDITNIGRDIREKKIPHPIFIGDENIENFTDLRKWKWTTPEFCLTTGHNKRTIRYSEVKPENYLNIIEKIYTFLDKAEKQYYLNRGCLKGMRIKKYLFSLIVINKNSRFDYRKAYIYKKLEDGLKDCIEEEFSKIDEDDKGKTIMIEAIKLLKEAFQYLSSEKVDLFREEKKQCSATDLVLLVPNKLKEELYETEKSSFLNARIMTLGEVKEQKYFRDTTQICILSLFGFEVWPWELLKELQKIHCDVNCFFYPEEIIYAQKIERDQARETNEELSSHDRVIISDIKFGETEIITPITNEDILENFYNENDFDYGEFIYEKDDYSGVETKYEIIYEDDLGKEILSGNVSVILEPQIGDKKKEKVRYLQRGDRIRVYNNLSKMELYYFAEQSDLTGIFQQIKKDSLCWKKALKSYYEKYYLNNDEGLLKELEANNVIIQIQTLKKWLDEDSDLWFPQKPNYLLKLHKIINNCEEFSKEAVHSALRSRLTFNGIMISLGRDLSDDIIEYILNGTIGIILSKFQDQGMNIDLFIDSSAPLKRISSIHTLDDDK